jgi:hypothetical protein
MPLYEYECSNPKCCDRNDGKPVPFTEHVPLRFAGTQVPDCPCCGTVEQVRKVIRTPPVKSATWRA